MDNEQLRSEIALRLEIEREVREQLRNIEEQSTAAKKSRWVWLESKLVLLIIGAVISGLLVPTFQFTQENIKWHKQNRYDSLERQLDNIRESLKQFVAVHGLSSELYDLGLNVLDTPTAAVYQTRWVDWRKEFRALRARRIQQNAAFAATVFYYPEEARDSIRKGWNNLLQPAQKLETLVGEILTTDAIGDYEYTKAKSTMSEVSIQLDASLSEVNQAYERVLTKLHDQLLEVENESTKFR